MFGCAGDLLLVLCLTMAASVLSASFAVFLVRERESHSKSVQVVAGAPPSAFWGATYAWDLLNFSIPALGEFSRSLQRFPFAFLLCSQYFTSQLFSC